MAVRRTPEATAQLRGELIEHARGLVRRNGPRALTIRALAADYGCAVGMIYKVFADRDELITDLLTVELRELAERLERWSSDTGKESVGDHLDGFAAIMLDSPATALVHSEEPGVARLEQRLGAGEDETGFLRMLERAVPDYLEREQRLGRVRKDVDTSAVGFLVTGAVHNLVAAGAGYHRPTRPELRAHLTGLARLIGPNPS